MIVSRIYSFYDQRNELKNEKLNHVWKEAYILLVDGCLLIRDLKELHEKVLENDKCVTDLKSTI